MRDWRQDSSRGIQRCDVCRVDYVVPEGEALPCGHDKGEQ